jgi:anti-sigma factor RsiW
MQLDHIRYRRYVDAFVDGELDGSLRERVGRHLALCPMCGSEAELTIHLKRSLARRSSLGERSAERLRRWARHGIR